MAKSLKVMDVAGGGVNLVKGPLQLADNEATQAQNAEFILNEATGGVGVLSKRGGLAILNSVAMAGTVHGMIGLPLDTTYTRTLYAARQTEDTNTFMTSTNGTTWTDTTTPVAPNANDKFGDNTNEFTARRMVSVKNFVVYGSDAYTQDTDNPEVAIYDGTDAYTMTSIPKSPSGNGSPSFVITDMLRVGNTIYLAISDPGGSSPDLAGRVVALDVTTGKTNQIANAFGNGTGEVTGGGPACMIYYLNQLWVGLNGSATTDGIGKIVRCFPGIETTWTTEVSNLRSHIVSLAAFKGDLYAAGRQSASGGARISKRTASSGVWSTQVTSSAGAGGNGHYASFVVDGTTAIYAVEYHSTAPTIHILRSTDGTTWSTDRDVDATDSGVAGNVPGSGVIYSSDSALYYVFRSTTVALADGFIMQRTSGGTWSKVKTDNFGGPINVLLTRS